MYVLYVLLLQILFCFSFLICTLYEGRSEINASYFIMLAHDVRGEYC